MPAQYHSPLHLWCRKAPWLTFANQDWRQLRFASSAQRNGLHAEGHHLPAALIARSVLHNPPDVVLRRRLAPHPSSRCPAFDSFRGDEHRQHLDEKETSLTRKSGI